jgi:integrase
MNRPYRAPLSEAEGTIWNLIVKKYFPSNTAIRSEATVKQYVYAFKDFREVVGHEPTLADLTDDNVSALMHFVVQRRESAVATANDRAGRIRAFWTWAAKRRLVENYPTAQSLKEPRRTPRGWTQDDLTKIMAECDVVGGRIAGVPGRLWWLCLHLYLWDTASRIGEALAIQWSWLDAKTGLVDVPFDCRKGGESDAVYQLHPETLAMLERIREPQRKLVFPWDRTHSILYRRYESLLKAAGLPHDSKCMFHRMRRSVASHLQAGGHNATAALGHSSAEVTKKSYIDPHIAGVMSPSTMLFRPGSSHPMFHAPVEETPAVATTPLPRDLLAAEWL